MRGHYHEHLCRTTAFALICFLESVLHLHFELYLACIVRNNDIIMIPGISDIYDIIMIPDISDIQQRHHHHPRHFRRKG